MSDIMLSKTPASIEEDRRFLLARLAWISFPIRLNLKDIAAKQDIATIKSS
jgi:hypothetical protein